MNAPSADTRADAPPQPELFVAYAESDADWVHGFLLPEIGLDPRSVLTPREFRPGAMLVTELERAVQSAQRTLVVLSPAFGLSHWSAFAELLATHDSLMRDSDRLIPLLLAPYELPLRLHARVRLDCTKPSRWESEIARLRVLLRREAPPAERLPCPYPGRVAFGLGEVLPGVGGRPAPAGGRGPLAGADAAAGRGRPGLAGRHVRRRGRVRGSAPRIGGCSPGHGAMGRAAAALLRPGGNDLPAAREGRPGAVPRAARPAPPGGQVRRPARDAGRLLRRPDDVRAVAPRTGRTGRDRPAARRRAA